MGSGSPTARAAPHDPTFGALAALYYGVPAACVLTAYPLATYALRLTSRWWTALPLVLYAVAAPVLFASGSDWCK